MSAELEHRRESEDEIDFLNRVAEFVNNNPGAHVWLGAR
jgi:hypothetical protein